MMSTDKCTITNRSPGIVSYYVDSTRTTRNFEPGVTYKVDYYEIEEVSKQPGGKELLANYFYIDRIKEMADDLNIRLEPEYFIPVEDLDNWMKTCELDAFKDALDYAPSGMKELIKTHAVSLPLNDIEKCDAIKEQLGFDVIMAVRNEKETLKEEEEKDKVPEAPRNGRRVAVAPESTPATPAPAQTTQRRTTPKYNVVKKEIN